MNGAVAANANIGANKITRLQSQKRGNVNCSIDKGNRKPQRTRNTTSRGRLMSENNVFKKSIFFLRNNAPLYLSPTYSKK